MLVARRAIESITLDKGGSHLKDEIMPRYAELIYNGFWFSPEREMLQALIDKSQKNVSGVVKLKLYKGNIIIIGRKSDSSLYSTEMATFEKDSVYNQKDAEGFIKLNALRLKLLKKYHLVLLTACQTGCKKSTKCLIEGKLSSLGLPLLGPE